MRCRQYGSTIWGPLHRIDNRITLKALRECGLLEILDIILLALISAYLVVLSVVLLIRLSRGETTGYDQLSLLPRNVETVDVGGKIQE